jgi:hypothetical protein
MSTQTLYAPLQAATMGQASIYVRETRDELLEYDKEELGALRFSIILTARWESSDYETPERRAELREDLVLLRKHYNDKIDEIAMSFGVEPAMKAKEEVERTVIVPREAKPLGPKSTNQENDEEEYSAGGYEL